MMTPAEKNRQFLTFCLGGGAVLLGAVILLSFLQEFIKRKLRERKLRRNARPPICSSEAHNRDDDDCEAVTLSIRSSLVVKKFESDMDETGHTMRMSESSLNAFSSHDRLDSDLQLSENADATESSSEESSPSASDTSGRRLSSIFRTSMRNLAEHIEAPPPPATTMLPPMCKLCNKFFENGEDICESSSPRCNHEFHQKCIQRWLSFQNTCPTCSETFVVVKSVDV